MRDGCAQCSGRIVDAGEEFVCSSCGSVTAKEVKRPSEEKAPHAIDYTSHSLGSFLGPMDYGYEERHSPGFSGSSSTFRYLKTISDFCLQGRGGALQLRQADGEGLREAGPPEGGHGRVD